MEGIGDDERPGSALSVGFGGRVLTWALDANERRGFEIGRLPGCFIQLAEVKVSRVHARVMPRRTATGFQWGVVDRSRNGTWIEGGTRKLSANVPVWFDREIDLRLFNPDTGPKIVIAVTSLQTVEDLPGLALSPAERTVLAGVRAGMSDKEIAAYLGLQPAAVQQRLKRLRARLADAMFEGERPSRAKLVELAGQLGVAPLR